MIVDYSILKSYPDICVPGGTPLINRSASIEKYYSDDVDDLCHRSGTVKLTDSEWSAVIELKRYYHITSVLLLSSEDNSAQSAFSSEFRKEQTRLIKYIICSEI